MTGSRKTVSQMPKWLWLDADEVARDGLDAVERGTIVRIVGARYRLIKALFKLLPDPTRAAPDRGVFGQFPRRASRRARR